MTTRDGDNTAALSAKFLQARIAALSTVLIKRLENIFAAALDEDHASASNRASSHSRANAPDVNPPSYADTAVKQLQLDVESTALIRAAEELMILTRSMKELWLFGGLDTIHDDAEGVHNGISATDRNQMQDDERVVMRGIRTFLDRSGSVADEPSSSQANGSGTGTISEGYGD